MVVAVSERCYDMLLALQQSPRDDDDNNSTSKFTMVHRSAQPTDTILVVPSYGVDDYTNKQDGGD
jgi:hypothetical protein